MVKELHTGSDTRKRPRSSEVAEMGEDRTLEQDILKKMGDLAAQLTEAAAYLEKAKRMMLEKMREIETLRRRNAELERREAQRFSGVPPMGSDGEVASVGAMEDTEEPLPSRAARGGQLQEAQGAGLPSGRADALLISPMAALAAAGVLGPLAAAAAASLGQLQAQGAGLPSGRAGARPAKAAARRRLADTGGGGGGEGTDDTGGSEWDGTDEDDDQEAWESPEGPTGGEGRGKGPRSRKRPGEGAAAGGGCRVAKPGRRRPSVPGGGLGGNEDNSADNGSLHQALPDKRTAQLASKWRAKAQGDPANVEAPTAGGGSESGAGSEGGGVGAKLDGVGDESLAINMLGPLSPEKLPVFIKCTKRQCTEKATFGPPDGSKPELCEKHKKPDMVKFVNEDEQVEDDAQNSSLIIKQEEASEEEANDTLLEPREEEKSNSRVSNKSRNEHLQRRERGPSSVEHGQSKKQNYSSNSPESSSEEEFDFSKKHSSGQQGVSSKGKQSPEKLQPFTERQKSNARRRAGTKERGELSDGKTEPVDIGENFIGKRSSNPHSRRRAGTKERGELRDGKTEPVDHGENLIGKRIKIRLLDDEEGLLTSFNKKTQEHTLVLYDDNSQLSEKSETVALQKTKFELIDEKVQKAPEEIVSFDEMDRSILQYLYGSKSRTVVDLVDHTTVVDLTEEDNKLNAGNGGAVCGVCLEAVDLPAGGGSGGGARRRRRGGGGGSPAAAAGGVGARGGEFASCGLCQATVHARCYHRPELLTMGGTLGQGWNCERCSRRISVEDASCYFCQQSGELVMRQIKAPVTANSRKGNTSTLHWAHLLCARWDPDVRITRSGEVLLNEDHIEFKQKPRAKTTCDICEDAGLCIGCCYPRCQRAMHAWCAKKHGHLQSGMSFGGRCLKIALCVVHKNMRPFPEQIIDYVEKALRFAPLVQIKTPEMTMTNWQELENYLQDKLKEVRGFARVKEGSPSDTHHFDNFQAALSKLLACMINGNMPTAAKKHSNRRKEPVIATNDYKRHTDERVKCLLQMLEDSLEESRAALETIGDDDAQQGQEVFAEGQNGGFFSSAPDMV